MTQIFIQQWPQNKVGIAEIVMQVFALIKSINKYVDMHLQCQQ